MPTGANIGVNVFVRYIEHFLSRTLIGTCIVAVDISMLYSVYKCFS